MKSLKKIGFVVVAIAMFLGFVSCDNNATTPAEPPHEHTFSDAWTKDSTHHWHAATCEHTDKVSGKAAHTFGAWTTPTGNADKTRTCSVCGYEETEHTFSTDWSSDDTYHWHAATCTHTGEVSGKERHDWGSGTVTKQPTETDDGEKTFTCSVCKKTKTETIPAEYTGPALKGFVNYRNEFEDAIKRTGANPSGNYSYTVEKIVFGLLSDNSVKTAIENTTVAATKADIGTVADVYYVYYDKDNKTVYIVPADENAEKIVLNPNCCCIFALFKCEKIEGLALCDTSKVTDMTGMFQGCQGLTKLDLSKFDTSKVTNMTGMFGGCWGLTELDLSKFDTSKVTDMTRMFQDCHGLTKLDLSKFDTSKVTNMTGMFERCYKLTKLDLSKFDTSKVTNMAEMFENCVQLTELDLSKFDTSKVKSMQNMFRRCETLVSLDLSKFNTSEVTDMGGMFYNCKKLASLNISSFDTSKVRKMASDEPYKGYIYGMFGSCSSLTELDLSSFDTSEVKYMNYLFNGCTKLTKIYVKNKGTFVPSGCDTTDMFEECGTSELTTKTN